MYQAHMNGLRSSTSTIMVKYIFHKIHSIGPALSWYNLDVEKRDSFPCLSDLGVMDMTILLLGTRTQGSCNSGQVERGSGTS